MKIKNWNSFNEGKLNGWSGSEFRTEKETTSVAEFQEILKELVALCGGKIRLIRDTYYDELEGPHADVLIEGKPYEIWAAGNRLWIKDFPFDNMENPDMGKGFIGTVEEISELINPTHPYPSV